MGNKRRTIAVLILGCYAVLAAATQFGANVAGQGLDPVWTAAQGRGVLRVATDFGYTPFTGTHMVLRNGVQREEPYGYDIDLAQALGAKLGLEVTFVPTSLEAAYETLTSDQADAVISALPYAPEQGWRASFSTFYFNAGQVLVVREDSPLERTDQLSGLTIGAALGSDADTLARSFVVQDHGIILRDGYDTPAEAMADLRSGTLDAVLADNAAAQIAINSAPGLRFVPPALTLEPYAIAVSNRAFVLHNRINIALDELRKEGWFEEAAKRWFVAAEPPS